VSDVDAAELVDDGPLAALLAPGGREHLLELILLLSATAAAAPELALVRLNPVLVTGDGAIAVDAWVRLQPWPTDPLAQVRHL
jgi:hypothetical protein